MSARHLIVVAIAAVTLAALTLQRDPHTPSEHEKAPPPATETRAPRPPSAIDTLNRQLLAGGVSLARNPRRGYLDDVLRIVGVAHESQLLVFSKTSRQHAQISEATPRAIYFNDRLYIGWVPGANDLEIAVVDDPRQGAQFYTLDQSKGRLDTTPLTPGARCFECHTLPASGGLQGLLMRTVTSPGVIDDATGADSRRLALQSSVIRTEDNDDATPFSRRWNGWFVTGERLPAGHLGRRPSADIERGLYLTPSSDVVALLVLGHQVGMTNLLLRLADAWRAPSTDPAIDAQRAALVQEVVEYMLFTHEAPLPAPINGDSGFAKTFSAQGRRDVRGRSLRDLDLERRVFRYRCSFMIDSPLFDRLPSNAKAAVYARLSELLSRRGDASGGITAEEGRAVLEILTATKSDLPRNFAGSRAGLTEAGR